jgi:opacity protein-like surface antigen
MHTAFLILAMIASVIPSVYGDDDLDLSFAEEDAAVKDTSNQKLLVVAKEGKDKNLDFSSIYAGVDLDALPKQVLAPALGTRGYRPNLIALNYGERTPGGGLIVEYNHNRIGYGLSSSWRRVDRQNQYFNNAYVIYRMLPFRTSPYFLSGAGIVSGSTTDTGLLIGAGVEAQIYYGLTLLAGYTYYSSVERSFVGGGIAWGF